MTLNERHADIQRDVKLPQVEISLKLSSKVTESPYMATQSQAVVLKDMAFLNTWLW